MKCKRKLLRIAWEPELCRSEAWRERMVAGIQGGPSRALPGAVSVWGPGELVQEDTLVGPIIPLRSLYLWPWEPGEEGRGLGGQGPS